MDRSSNESAEQVAQLSGRAASWADQAGAALGEVSVETAATVGAAGHRAADAAERYALRVGERLARATGHWAGALSELALRAGDALSEEHKPPLE